MGSWLPWRRARAGPSVPAGLSDPAHPARRWIDNAATIVDRRFELSWEAGAIGIRFSPDALADLIGALDLAIGVAPSDADLLALRGAARLLPGEDAAAQADLDAALRRRPGQIEAAALSQHGRRWNSLYFLPPWSGHARALHPVTVALLQRGEALQAVRHGLEAALLLTIVDHEGAIAAAPRRHRWELVYSATPHGPVGAHYALLDLDGSIRRQEFVLTPPTRRHDGDTPGTLMGRLAGMRTCFIAVVAPSGELRHNLRHDVTPAQGRTLEVIARAMSEAPATSAQALRLATDWHMAHVALESVDFP